MDATNPISLSTLNCQPATDSPARTVVILQPSYLPWLGYLAQFHRADVFVVYDDVQYDSHSWRNRNRIKTATGAQWLTVPVHKHGRDWPTNREIEIDNSQNWRRKHLLSIRQNYSRAAFFSQYFPPFEAILSQPWERLLDLNMAVLQALAAALEIERTICFSSQLGVGGSNVERLIGICKALRADRFYEGAAGRNYIDDQRFADAGIEIEYQDYKHPVYTQLHGEFVSHLSAIDLLFNNGPASLELMTS
jgi:hypothetical protein